jgi:beta-galactosidase
MAVREPNPEPLEIKTTWWAVWPTWESWNWPGYEGKNIDVEIYSKYEKVRLYLNNKLLGEKPTGIKQEFKATFSVPYTAGTLKAVGVENDKEVESSTLQTAGNAARLKLTADRKEISANGQDLAYITIEVTDKNGVVHPNAANRLNFKIEGGGTIAGTDNADIKDVDPYVGNSHKAWHGRALVVIKSTHKAGEIKLTVTSNGLEPKSIIIKSIK